MNNNILDDNDEDTYYKIPSFSNKQLLYQKKDKVYKKTMCKNIANYNNCTQGFNCHFAHSLDEQVVDNDRKYVYDILNSNVDLSDINLSENKILYEILKILTNLCSRCLENRCTGGYNCRNGACLEKYHICSKDLNYGFCNDQYTFAKLMELVSEKTGYPVGEMHWMITNLHIYPRHYDLL
jgi:hypothetical protein